MINLPTGAGKTSVLHIWLLALAWSRRTNSPGVPRRLAWVVNRRVVVDQVTTEALELLSVNGGLSRCPEIRDLLASASLSGTPLAVSTLRGEKADNGDWSRDPSTPAVVIGTVDMIGSRLLFRGYRIGRYHRPVHAGLLGVDTLIVNDEAHLSPAFAKLLAEVHSLRPAARIPGQTFRVMLLSATPSESSLRTFAHDPQIDADEHEHFRAVFEAKKELVLHEVDNRTVEATMWRLATESQELRNVVFVEQPERAADLARRLRKDGRKACLLTGTMRGFERDQLAGRPEFQRFLQPQPGDTEPIWLVATSAGEVGINLTCERMITGLVEADSLLQRFGRLNRFGGPRGEAHVVYAPPSPKRPQLVETLSYLKSLRGDVSCRHVWQNPAPPQARTEQPLMARLEDRLIETWSMTSYSDRGMPTVAKWLHGKQDDNYPEAEIAWRDDIQTLIEWGIDTDTLEQVIERYPVRSHERIRERASRLLKKFADLASALGPAAQQQRVLVVSEDGSVRVLNVAALAEHTDLARKLLLLPPGVGVVDEHGMFVGEPGGDGLAYDVADIPDARNRRRYQIDEAVWSRVGIPEAPFAGGSDRAELGQFAREHYLRVPFVVRHPEDDSRLLAYFEVRTAQKNTPSDVPLEVHRLAVAAKAEAVANRLLLPRFAPAMYRAGELHDEGKINETWQRAMGGSSNSPLAKSKSPANLRLIDGYRHELGSLNRMHGEQDELVAHLVASHHAGARPFFETRQYERASLRRSEEAALEAARRFGRQQKEWGPWGLAYLEALFKCADGLVSGAEGEAASE